MLFIFFWKVYHELNTAFPFVILMCQKLYLEKQAISQYLENFHGIGNICWRPAWKDCTCTAGIPYYKVTEDLIKLCMVKVVSK